MSFLGLIRKFASPPAPSDISFTPRAQRVLDLANEHARREGREIANSSDVVVGLLGLGQGVAWNVLKRFGIDESALQKPSAPGVSIAPYTELLPRAQQEMRRLHHTYLGTEHLLLAVLSEKNNQLSAILSERGFTAAILREEILKELDPNYTPPPVS